MFETDPEFEDEVRRIARQLWPTAEFGGAAIVDGRERDGIFVTEDIVNIIECTVSRKEEKARQDCAKIDGLVRKYRLKYPMKLVRGWFITMHEPTADQKKVASHYKGTLQACAFDHFRARLVDARSYLDLRKNYAFGSIRDPETLSTQIDRPYVQLDIFDESATILTVTGIGELLASGRRLVLTGDYGAGKSATTREVFRYLARKFWTNESNKFPLTLNLRDHHGQRDPVEAVERHARSIGFSNPSSLVRAWRAGYCIVILDGFDEIASAGWLGAAKKLRDLRYNAMELVRKFISGTPTDCGVLLIGRAHFFDNSDEMSRAFGNGLNLKVLKIADLTNEQVGQFLAAYGWRDAIPDWLPTRPLLLGYLASRNLLARTLETDFGAGPAVGWNELLDRIAAREAEIEAGIEAIAVRRIVEHLATLARGSVDGLGPLTPDAIVEAFKTICGYMPDDRGLVLLQRLPGLGGRSAEDGSRVFIDRDFVEAARAGSVFEYIQDPYTVPINPEGWQTTLRNLGAEIVACRCSNSGLKVGKVEAALVHATEQARFNTLCADLVQVLIRMDGDYDGRRIYVQEVLVEELSLEEVSANLSKVEFQDSVITRLELSSDLSADKLPRFLRCHFGLIEGSTGEKDLPVGCFKECSFIEFESTARTTKGLLALDLPIATKVMLTIMKKLYAQRGSGRKESAFFRGLDFKAQQYVKPMLQFLSQEGFALRSNVGNEPVWHSSKASSSRSRALRILASPIASRDPLLLESAGIVD